MQKVKLCLWALAVALCALGLTISSPKPAAAQSCCGGGPESIFAETNAVPDLMTNCPVSGDKLGEMDKPFAFTYKGQEVKLCCKGCKKNFDKDPAKYIKKIEEAGKLSLKSSSTK
jgi:YHS domain-containing protein